MKQYPILRAIAITIVMAIVTGYLTATSFSADFLFEHPFLYKYRLWIWFALDLVYAFVTLLAIKIGGLQTLFTVSHIDRSRAMHYAIPAFITLLILIPGVNFSNNTFLRLPHHLSLISNCITGALYQEVMFRGIIQNILAARGRLFSIFMTASATFHCGIWADLSMGQLTPST